ncbi:MAG: hypothetical protein K0M55_19285 [Rhizobium sp.]|nr:hypothetical protein [Rhizobium sp.]MBW8318429.1 hypothetical protein [Rhizobium sp.]MBW8445345.1 hypothetical protein [Arenimonas sp.]
MSHEIFKLPAGLPTPSMDVDTSDADIIRRGRGLFGPEFSTALALCALDAWLDANDREFRRWSALFNKLRN